MQAIARQNFERARLIDELRATRSALAASEREAGILAERQRLAREIHDTLAQGFISIITHLEAADLAVPAGCTDGRRHLRQAQTTARENLVDPRRLVQDLRPMPLAEAALPDAVEAVGTRWAENWQGDLQVIITGDPYPLAEEVENTLLRATQEALHNVRKHADASEATITLSYMPDTVILDVYDNGRGFDATADILYGGFKGEGGGFGLRAIRERAANVGGKVEIEGAPGDGTTVTVVVPIDPRGRSNAAEVQV